MPTRSIEYRRTRDIPLASLLSLYRANAWSAADKPELLGRAIANSEFVVSAWDSDELVGLGNALSDGHLVVYSTGVVDHEEDIESSKIDRLDAKEVAGPDISGMSPEKDPPSGGRSAVKRSSHILRHSSGRDPVTQPIQLRLDPLLTPQSVLRSYAPNKIPQLSRDLVPPSPISGP